MRLGKIVVLVGALTIAAATAEAEITTATTAFTYGEEGVLDGVITLDEATPGGCDCKLTLRGNISFSGDTEATAQRTLLKNVCIKKNKTSITLYAAGLYGINPNDDDQDPVLTLQPKIKCVGTPKFFGPATARFVLCGRGSKAVGPEKFLEKLDNNLKTPAIKTSAARYSAARTRKTMDELTGTAAAVSQCPADRK